MKSPSLLAALVLTVCLTARADEFDIPPQAVEAFARNLQDALAKADARRVAALVHYPLRVNTLGAKTRQLSRTQLLKEFDAVFPPAVVKQVLDQDPTDLFRNYQGVMFGNGAVWANEFCGPAVRPHCPVLITAVNRPAR